ncbi:MAG: DUF1592 domain-containing protein [Planctomycetaceae bacterium]|nr:DUF1592 domain-containing protein [Planctomycetaceae bacterium]
MNRFRSRVRENSEAGPCSQKSHDFCDGPHDFCDSPVPAESGDKKPSRRCVLLFCVAFLSQLAIPVDGRGDDDAVTGFLKQNCTSCHGAETREANIRLDEISLSSLGSENVSAAADATSIWNRVLNVVEFGEMPPSDQTQPTTEAVQAFRTQIIESLARHAGNRPAALRRLNRREYENTVHDLLGIQVPLSDLLPEDGSVQGFDNVADGLSISSVLMEQYLEAADTAFEAAIRRIRPLPAEVRRVQLMDVSENIDSVDKAKGGTIEVENSFVKFTPGWPPARLDAVHPIEDGVYRCRVAVWPHDAGERTLSLAIYVGSLFGPETRKFIGIFDVTGTSKEPRVIEFTTFLKEGHAIHLEPRIWPEHVTWRDKHEKRPGIGIVWSETHGPLDQDFPSLSQNRLFGSGDTISMQEDRPIYMRHRKGVKTHIVVSTQPEQDAERIIYDFLPRAFRRPVTAEDAEPFVRLTLDRLQSGRTFEQAIRAGVTAVLCSPQFLTLNSATTVDDFTIASRLSYFLWSTMPDQELLLLAGQGRLSQPEVRSAQIERMLRDERSENFVNNFTGQWLNLRDIEFTTPDKKLYPEFDHLLQEAMVAECRQFFHHVLMNDLSVTSFIDSDWTFLNERLARHYGIPGVKGNEILRRTSIPDDSIRGGVMTQAGVLKVTANGTTTSPVIRGIWVLDHLLGRPAPPPPPGVPAVEPDIRGATTIREQLDKHRNIAACASCHRRIDPPGFAMEEFDAIGGVRSWYRSVGEGEKLEKRLPYFKGHDVNSTAVMADGREFSSFKEFRQCLLQDREIVARAIAGKLLTYSTGRRLVPGDRKQLDSIVMQAESSNLGLKSMIHAIVNSDLFLSP